MREGPKRWRKRRSGRELGLSRAFGGRAQIALQREVAMGAFELDESGLGDQKSMNGPEPLAVSLLHERER